MILADFHPDKLVNTLLSQGSRMSKIYQDFGTKIMEIEVAEVKAPIYQWRGNNVRAN